MPPTAIRVSLSDEDRRAIDDLAASNDELAELLDEYVDISTDTTLEFSELVEASADRVSRVCEVVRTVALIVIALALLF